jgi:aspartyl protease family protein
MRQIVLLALGVVVVGAYAARKADETLSSPPQLAAVQEIDAPRAPVHSGRSLMLEPDRQGHFHAEGRIDGRFVEFIVDTGASVVALRESDAARAGLRPFPSDYIVTVSTANGKTKAAPARLDRIEIGDITVYDVRAIVLPDDALSVNLLGTDFLSRLKRYEYANGRMLLEE